MVGPAWCELAGGHGILAWRSTAGSPLTGLMHGIEVERNPDRGLPATRVISPGRPDRASQGRESRSGGGCWSGSGIRLTDARDLGVTIRGVPFSHLHVRVGAELQQVDVCDAGRERDVRGAGGRPAGRALDAGRGAGPRGRSGQTTTDDGSRKTPAARSTPSVAALWIRRASAQTAGEVEGLGRSDDHPQRSGELLGQPPAQQPRRVFLSGVQRRATCAQHDPRSLLTLVLTVGAP